MLIWFTSLVKYISFVLAVLVLYEFDSVQGLKYFLYTWLEVKLKIKWNFGLYNLSLIIKQEIHKLITLKLKQINTGLYYYITNSFHYKVWIKKKKYTRGKKYIIYKIFVHLLLTFQYNRHFDLNIYHEVVLPFVRHYKTKLTPGHLGNRSHQPWQPLVTITRKPRPWC